MNVHKYAVPTNAAVAALAQEDYLKNIACPSVFLHGAPDPTAYHFHSVFLGIDRAIDYLTTRPDWNRKQLVLEGASQGGWLTLVMAGLKNDKVTAAAAGVPFLSDLGRSYGSASGFIKQLNAMQGAEALVPYYAGVNFARFIQCPVILSVGYLDSSCFPSSVYAAYNVIPSADKKLYVGPLAGHPLTAEYRQAEHAFLIEHLGLNKK
jgi:cephalosporin-C deacetylase-like acetyl esterase